MNKKTYTPPRLSALKFPNERGYSASNPIGIPKLTFLELLFGDEMPAPSSIRETETFNVHSTWNEDYSSSFWD